MLNRRSFLKAALAGGAAAAMPAALRAATSSSRPNIIFILADDLGYGDLGCYGQDVIETPNLDRMGGQGMRFTDFYAGSTVCAPSRSCLLTGLHTGHTYMRGNGKDVWLRDDPQDITVARLLKNAGYSTAMIGKSSTSCGVPDDLGHPNKKGFDHFFGVLSHWQAHFYYPETVYRDGEAIELKDNHSHHGEYYCHDLYLQDALGWIEEQSKQDDPFFMLYSAHIPHASLVVEPDRWKEMYEDKIEDDRKVPQRHYSGTDAAKAEFAGMVSRLDWEVGRIIRKLQSLGIDENTIVMFASDNGAMNEGGHLEDDFNSSGPLRGIKRELYEGGIRSPFIVRWPGRIEAGTVSHHVSTFWDFLPTACELAGARAPGDVDGISFLPTLMGDKEGQDKHDYLYWEFHERRGRRAVRIGDYKAIQYDVNRDPDGPVEVYNVAKDIDESENIAATHPEIVARARKLFKTARTRSPIERFNFPDSG